MIDEKIARVKALIQKREEIDAELAVIFGGGGTPRRGRPRKDQRGHTESGDTAAASSPSAAALRDG